MTGQDGITKIMKNAFSLSDVLNSEIFYKQLNELNLLDECNGYCASFPKRNKKTSVKNICKRTLSYLKIKYSNPDSQNDKYDACTLLNYWVYNRLYMAYGFKNDSKFVQDFGDLQPIWNDFIDKVLNKKNTNICKPIFSIATETDWQKRKELLDYCSNVNDLRNITYSYSHICNESYQYIKKKTELYKEYELLCDSDNTDRCPTFFNKCRKYKPENVLSTLNCHQEMEKMKAVASANLITKDRENQESPASEAVPVVASQNLSGNPQTVENVGNIFLGVVATTMTSGALYRFTRLGNMLRNIFGWNTNNMRNFNGGDIRLYDYASESFNPYPGEEHNIGYHPA